MDVIIRRLWMEISDLVKENCEGCREDYLNQQGHICVMNTDFDNLLSFFDEAFERVYGVSYLFKLKLEIHMYASLEGWTLRKAKRFCDYSNTSDNPIEVSSDDDDDNSL